MLKGCKVSSWLRPLGSSSSQLLQLTLIQRRTHIFLAPMSLNLIPVCPAQYWLVTDTDMLPLLVSWAHRLLFTQLSLTPDAGCPPTAHRDSPVRAPSPRMDYRGSLAWAVTGLLGMHKRKSADFHKRKSNITHFSIHSQESPSLFENNPFLSLYFLTEKQTLDLHYFIVQINNAMMISTHSFGPAIAVVLSPRLLQLCSNCVLAEVYCSYC